MSNSKSSFVQIPKVHVHLIVPESNIEMSSRKLHGPITIFGLLS